MHRLDIQPVQHPAVSPRNVHNLPPTLAAQGHTTVDRVLLQHTRDVMLQVQRVPRNRVYRPCGEHDCVIASDILEDVRETSGPKIPWIE